MVFLKKGFWLFYCFLYYQARSILKMFSERNHSSHHVWSQWRSPRTCFICTQWSLSTGFSSCHWLTKSLGTNCLVKKVLPYTSQLYVQIERIILSNRLSNTLRFPDANLLVLLNRVNIAFLAPLQSSWMSTFKLPLFVTIVPGMDIAYRFQVVPFRNWNRVFKLRMVFLLQTWLLSFYYWHTEFPLLVVYL